MISWLTWNVCFWIIGTMLVLAYLWADGTKLLGETVLLVFWALAISYIILLALIMAAIVVAAYIIGPIARVCFHKDTTRWSGDICQFISGKGFWWLDKIKAINEKKLAELEAQKDVLENPIPEATGKENREYPDGFYKLQWSDDEVTKHLCPYCKGHLMAGPEAGASMNVKCSSCHALFNYTSFNGMLEEL